MALFSRVIVPLLATATYNPTGSADKTIKVSSTAGVTAGMVVSGLGFAKNQVVLEVVDNTTLLLNAAADGDPYGVLQFKSTSWGYNDIVGKNESSSTGDSYASSIQVSKDLSTVLVSAPIAGKLFVYKLVDNQYALSQTMTHTGEGFAQGITVSDEPDKFFEDDALGRELENHYGILESREEYRAMEREEVQEWYEDGVKEVGLDV